MSNQPKESSPTSALTREVIPLSIDEGFYCLRGLSPQTLRFEIEYGLERGTTANAFLINPNCNQENKDHSAILIHPPGEKFSNAFLPILANQLHKNAKELLVIV